MNYHIKKMLYEIRILFFCLKTSIRVNKSSEIKKMFICDHVNESYIASQLE